MTKKQELISTNTVFRLKSLVRLFSIPFSTLFEVVDGEQRESLIGMTVGWQLLFVVYTIRNETIRIIFARLATRHERRAYEEQ